jgi:hypothetical protein
MRDRHPDLFSDSFSEVEYEVEREVLSYHLETLTNQKDETAFENFAQRLCEKFIAPNIRPQTGPVGGGRAFLSMRPSSPYERSYVSGAEDC